MIQKRGRDNTTQGILFHQGLKFWETENKKWPQNYSSEMTGKSGR